MVSNSPNTHCQIYLGVHNPKYMLGFFLSHVVFDLKVTLDLASNTNSSRASAVEHDAVITRRHLVLFLDLANSVDDTRKDDSTCALDIVIEAEHLILILVQEAECVFRGPVFKLNEEVGVHRVECCQDCVYCLVKLRIHKVSSQLSY